MTNKKLQKKYWSQDVTEKSHALALEAGVFSWHDPVRIAKSIKKSAVESTHRKSPPFQSAMSMLNFYINRAGKKLDPNQRIILEKAKNELHALFDRKKIKMSQIPTTTKKQFKK